MYTALSRRLPTDLRGLTMRYPIAFAYWLGVRVSNPELLSQSQTRYHYANSQYLAGVSGFEPENAGIKTLCLTAWLYPNKKLDTLLFFDLPTDLSAKNGSRSRTRTDDIRITLLFAVCVYMEPQTRVELVTVPWQGTILPLNYCDKN